MNLQENISLRPYNTFGIEAYAKYFVSFHSINEFEALLSNPDVHTIDRKLILGGGSNLLFTRNFDGLVMKNEITGIEIIKEDEDFVYVKAGAGENWHQFVLYCLKKQLCRCRKPVAYSW